jgi:DNA-binding NarL/FixJ family response regulator
MANNALLDEVRAAAEAALEARASGEETDEPARRALTAARAALDGGHPISAIAAAEAEGEHAAREHVGTQVLRTVERSAKKLRDTTEEYERTVVQAVRLGLPARDIAARAGVSHGTVAAVARRHEQAPTAPPEEAAPELVEDVTTREPAPDPGTG